MIVKKIIRGIYYKFLPFEKQAKRAGVVLGENNRIATRFWSSEPYLITIGSNCSITKGVRMFTHGGNRVFRSQMFDFDVFGKVKIGNYVYIGTNALIMPGVVIGDNVLVAAGSVVTKSIPPKVVVGGNPARIICTIDEYKNKISKYNIHTKGMSAVEKKKILLSMDDS